MVDPVTAVYAGTAIIGAASSIIGGKKAASAAKKAGRMNARYIRQETAEQVRRLEYQNQMTQRTTKAYIGASGVLRRGTPMEYLAEMKEQQRLQVDWLRESGRQRAKIARETGQQVAAQQMTSGIMGGISQLTNAYTSGLFDSTTPSNYTFKETSPWSISNTPIIGGTLS